MTGLLEILPPAFADEGCGGSKTNKHPQPPLTRSASTWSTKADAVDALPSTCHLVPDYASGNDGFDYHDPKTLYDCTHNSFRYQSIMYEESRGVWRHSRHHAPGEPNPEVFAYLWPTWCWPFYVDAWHGD